MPNFAVICIFISFEWAYLLTAEEVCSPLLNYFPLIANNYGLTGYKTEEVCSPLPVDNKDIPG